MSFTDSLAERILILDGAMGTMIQRSGVLAPDSELLNLTSKEVIENIHRRYVDAGADIITANSFGANSISQQRHGYSDRAAEMAFKAAAIARKVADEAPRRVYVAGSIGPTGHSLSIPSGTSSPAERAIDFDSLSKSYTEQISALVEGGSDLLLIETCFDALNAKAAIYAAIEAGNTLPVIISATVSDRSGRLLTGQSLEAFYHSVRHCPFLAAFGLNCSMGITQMTPLIEEIASFSDLPVIFYPNAGMPDAIGRYNDSPSMIASAMARLASKGLVNIAGGCCGTAPEHIAAIAGALAGVVPGKRAPQKKSSLTVCGLEPVYIDKTRNFTNIGERTNVAGSKRFARLISSGQYGEALSVAREQVEGGATVIDINVDDPMLDATREMRTFLRHIATEPSVARSAVMIDSSKWETIEEGLKNAQGKCIVNSISLRDGEDEFIRKALTIRKYGAAMVVMAFDESGQATTLERKVGICRRSYRLLTEAGIGASEIIFDCNILSIGTGIPEHSRFGVDFIEAVREIKASLPGALTSGGLSNLSFAFRGNNAVREAMHSIFLYHAIRAGLDMAIVNPSMLQVYDTIGAELKKCIEDVIFDSDPDASSRLLDAASKLAATVEGSGNMPSSGGVTATAPETTAGERLCQALVLGGSNTLESDVMQALASCGRAIDVVEGPLLKGMERVGALFAEGKMFLPQVVRSAKVMRDAVELLQPYMKGGQASSKRPKFLIATVQGDVHDIGKNITATVLQCSGFEVVDLGVMVPSSEILLKATQEEADIIGVSGLITPSLSRMEELCREMASRRMTTPLFVGGAATSAVHTAVKLRRIYDYVFYGAGASDTAVMAKKYMASPESFIAGEAGKLEEVRTLYLSSARDAAATDDPSPEGGYALIGIPEDIPLKSLPASELTLCFDWKLFNSVCGKGSGDKFASQVRGMLDSGAFSVTLCARFFPAHRKDCSIIFSDNGSEIALPMLKDAATGACLADYFPTEGESPLGMFAVVAHDSASDSDMIRHAVAVTLAEAGAVWIRRRVESFIKESGKQLKLIAPGIGYPCCPDHSLKRDVLRLLPGGIGIELTESCAMIPEASVCGLLIAHEDARYRDLRRVEEDFLDKYSRERGFSAEESRIFLDFLR